MSIVVPVDVTRELLAGMWMLFVKLGYFIGDGQLLTLVQDSTLMSLPVSRLTPSLFSFSLSSSFSALLLFTVRLR